MNKLALLGTFTCLTLLCFSQQNTVSSGGDASGYGGNVSYSIGQVDYISSQGTNGTTNQGVQQPYEFYELGVNEEFLLDVSLFPNPTNEFIILKLNDLINNLSYSLYDLNGKIVATNILEALETQIDMRALTVGQYNLKITNSTNIIKSITIIKN